MVGTLKNFASNFVKLEHFDGGNFIRCKKEFLPIGDFTSRVCFNFAKHVENENETIIDRRKS